MTRPLEEDKLVRSLRYEILQPARVAEMIWLQTRNIQEFQKRAASGDGVVLKS